MDYKNISYVLVPVIERLRRIESLVSGREDVFKAKLMNMKDIVKYTGLSEPTIRRGIQRGKLKPFKKDGKKLFRRKDVNNWLEAK